MSSRTRFLLGAGLLAAGVIGAVIWFVTSQAHLADKVDGFQRVALPGSATLQLSARKYIVYYEASHADKKVRRFEFEILDAQTGTRVKSSRYRGSLTYSLDGHTGSAQATVTPPRAGRYQLSVGGDASAGAAGVALGASVAGDMRRRLLGTLAIGGLLAVPGVILLGLAGVRRRRARRGSAPDVPASGSSRGGTA